MTIVIIDASYYFVKSYFSAPEEAVTRLKKMIDAAIEAHNPDRVVAALDAGKITFRSELFPSYKANRPSLPSGFSTALPAMKQSLTDMGIQSYSAKGYEGDDIVGTLCALHEDDDRIIMGLDHDLMQLVRDGVSLWNNGVWIREAEVIAKFGVYPKHVTDVMGLSGDSGDGIPGVPGIGAKIASSLVRTFGPLESVFDNLNIIAAGRGGARISATLRQSKEMAFLSRELATIVTTVDLSTGIGGK